MEFIYDADQIQILLKVFFAMFLGAIVGFDREMAKKPAGLRTHMLICGAAALLVSLGYELINYYDFVHKTEIIRSDPVRIIEAIITGISFVAAGTIIRNRSREVKGLTTAASMLLSASVGIAVAIEYYLLAAGVSVTALIILRFFRVLEDKIHA